MRALFLGCLLLSVSLYATAQVRITNGDKSPVIIGANAKIKYINEQRTKLDIPKELTPYLAGLLMSNNISAKSGIDNALLAWTRKYSELQKAVGKAGGNIRSAAMAELEKGNFTEVERLLNVHTNYGSLIRTFPQSYQTNGSESPIIVGDYGNITYTVTQIIEYNLPEGVTVSLLSELRSKDNSIRKQGAQIKNLSESLESKSDLVKRWVSQYRVLEQQLKNSPDSVGRRAYAQFRAGDLKGALRILDLAAGSEVTMAKNRILKARILLLQLNYDSLDVQLKTIRIYFATSIPFVSDYQNLIDYAKLLVDYLSDGAAATPVLLQALESAQSLSEQVEVRNYLSLAYAATNKDKAREYLESAMTLLESNEPLADTALIEMKGLIQYNLAIAYNAGNFDTVLIRRGIALLAEAVNTFGRRPHQSTALQYRSAVCEAMAGKYYSFLNDTLHAQEQYARALSFLEKAAAQNPTYTLALSRVYLAVGELLAYSGATAKAQLYFSKARDILEPRVSINATVYFVNLVQVYTDILRTYEASMQTDSLYPYLHRLEVMVKPFAASNPGQFAFYQAGIFTDLGRYFIMKNDAAQAKPYLQNAYQYYSDNFSQVQYDKSKFQTCLYSLNAAYIQTGDLSGATGFNHHLKTELIRLKGINPFVFEDFVPQVYSQLGDVYAALEPGSDSSVYYAEKAIDLCAAKALQYPLLYNISYFDYSMKACGILLQKGRNSEAEKIAAQYVKAWENVFEVSELARNFLRGYTAECVGKFAWTFQQAAASPPATVRARKELLEMAGKYYGVANDHFEQIGQKTPLEQLQYARLLTERSVYEGRMRSAGTDNHAAEHQQNKCRFRQRAKEVLAALPVSMMTAPLLSQLNTLQDDCE